MPVRETVPQAPDSASALRERVTVYLRAHHTMTLATAGPAAGFLTITGVDDVAGDALAAAADGLEPWNLPHAASVFYAVDASLRLIFLSKPSSLHGAHIGSRGPVAATVTKQYDDWEAIQGLQLWGEARLLKGAGRVTALAVYLARFPFVEEMVKRPKMAALLHGIGVYRVDPRRFAFTDNTTGVFGREVLEMKVE